MSQFTNERWIDFGDFGQHKATVSGVLGEFPYISSVAVTVKDETIELVRLLPKDQEQIIIEEETISEREYRREQAEDRRFDEMREAA